MLSCSPVQSTHHSDYEFEVLDYVHCKWTQRDCLLLSQHDKKLTRLG
jgi:hypothetical protein